MRSAVESATYSKPSSGLKASARGRVWRSRESAARRAAHPDAASDTTSAAVIRDRGTRLTAMF
jgi:hypothetical protein